MHKWLEQIFNVHKALLPVAYAALEMAAILADIKPGDEIIMPSFTFYQQQMLSFYGGGYQNMLISAMII